MAIITLNWRIIRPLLLALFCLALFVYYLDVSYRPPTTLYVDLFDAETRVSKKLIHNEIGKKYVKFKQLQGAGFNNQAQEILLYHHLALQTDRIYVYQPLVWRPRGEGATVPLSAFLRGPTEGTISEAVFEEVCPPEQIVRVKLRVDYSDQWRHALKNLNRQEKCVVVEDKIFNWGYLTSSSVQEIWPTFQNYIHNHFKWSDHVLEIVNRTQVQLNLQPTTNGDPYMALHLRRGDFEEHCKYLAQMQEGFTTWATLPLLAPAIYPPSMDVYNATTIIDHCYPSLRRILDAITNQARNRPHLRTLHILHDGAWDHPTVYLQFYKLAEVLKHALWAERQGWKGGPMLRVTQSADVPIVRGERDWSVCVDVELGRRAEVFIGNGYSSLSTQVVALRLGANIGTVKDITLY